MPPAVPFRLAVFFLPNLKILCPKFYILKMTNFLPPWDHFGFSQWLVVGRKPSPFTLKKSFPLFLSPFLYSSPCLGVLLKNMQC